MESGNRNEAKGLKPSKEAGINNISIGQCMNVTPVQMLGAINTIVNNGVYEKPYIVESILDKDDNIIKEFKTDKKRVYSETTSKLIKNSMRQVIIKGTIFNGPIVEFGGGLESSGFSIMSSGVKIYNNRFNNMQYHSCANANYTIPVDTATLGIQTNTAPVIITTPKDFEYYSKEFLINVTWYANTITFKNSDGSESIAAGIIAKQGWYKLTRAGTTWRVFALSIIDSTSNSLQVSSIFDPESLPSGSSVSSAAITVTGAKVGDFVQVSAPYSLQGISATAYVKTTDTVIIVLINLTGTTIDLGSGTWIVKVAKSS